MKRIYAAVLMALTIAPSAYAQNMMSMMIGEHGAQTVTANFQISQPAPAAASTSDLSSLIASTTQSLYDIVNHECDILSVSLKGSCKVVMVNVGANINNRGGVRGPFVSANALATFEITPIAAATPPAH